MTVFAWTVSSYEPAGHSECGEESRSTACVCEHVDNDNDDSPRTIDTTQNKKRMKVGRFMRRPRQKARRQTRARSSPGAIQHMKNMCESSNSPSLDVLASGFQGVAQVEPQIDDQFKA